MLSIYSNHFLLKKSLCVHERKAATLKIGITLTTQEKLFWIVGYDSK